MSLVSRLSRALPLADSMGNGTEWIVLTLIVSVLFIVAFAAGVFAVFIADWWHSEDWKLSWQE